MKTRKIAGIFLSFLMIAVVVFGYYLIHSDYSNARLIELSQLEFSTLQQCRNIKERGKYYSAIIGVEVDKKFVANDSFDGIISKLLKNNWEMGPIAGKFDPKFTSSIVPRRELAFPLENTFILQQDQIVVLTRDETNTFITERLSLYFCDMRYEGVTSP